VIHSVLYLLLFTFNFLTNVFWYNSDECMPNAIVEWYRAVVEKAVVVAMLVSGWWRRNYCPSNNLHSCDGYCSEQQQ